MTSSSSPWLADAARLLFRRKAEGCKHGPTACASDGQHCLLWGACGVRCRWNDPPAALHCRSAAARVPQTSGPQWLGQALSQNRLLHSRGWPHQLMCFSGKQDQGNLKHMLRTCSASYTACHALLLYLYIVIDAPDALVPVTAWSDHDAANRAQPSPASSCLGLIQEHLLHTLQLLRRSAGGALL